MDLKENPFSRHWGRLDIAKIRDMVILGSDVVRKVRDGAKLTLVEKQETIPYAPPRNSRPLSEVFCELGHTLRSDADRLLKNGTVEEAAERFNEAAQAFNQALREHQREHGKGSLSIQLYLAQVRLAQNRPADALQNYLEAVILEPNVADSVLPVAHQLLQSEHARSLKIAEPRLVAALEDQSIQNDDRALIENLVGRLHYFEGDYEGAIQHFSAGLQSNPASVYIREGLSDALLASGKPTDAVKMLTEAVRLSSDSPVIMHSTQLRLKLAKLLLNLKRYEEARPVIEAGLQQTEESMPEFRVLLGKCYLGIGQPDTALQIADQLLGAVDDEDLKVEANVLRAAALRDVKRYKEASDAAEAALKINPTHLEAVRVRGEALILSAKDRAAGIRLLEYYVQRVPDDIEVHNLLLDAMRKTNRPKEEILRAIQRALQSAPPGARPGLLVNLADTQSALGDLAAALHTLEEFAKLGTTKTERYWTLLASVKQAMGQYQEAVKAYRDGLDQFPANIALHENLARLLENIDRQEAISVWRSLTEKNPKYVSGYLNLGNALLEAENYSEAFQVASQVIENNFTVPVEAYQLRAEARLKMGGQNHEAAEDLYRAAEKLSNAYNFDSALATLEKVLEIDSSYAPAYWLKAECERLRPVTEEQPNPDYNKLIELMDKGFAIRAPEQHESWVFVTRATLNLPIGKEPSEEQSWQGATFIERSLLMSQNNSMRWGVLSSFYRTLNLTANSLAASEKAIEVDERYTYSLDEWLITLANNAEFERAEQVLEMRKKATYTTDAWLNSMEGFLRIHQARYEEALQLVQDTAKDYWVQEVRATALRKLGQNAEATKVYSSMRDQLMEKKDNELLLANVTFYLGLLGETDYIDVSYQMFEKLTKSETKSDRANGHQMLGFIHLLRGEGERAMEEIDRALELATSPRDPLQMVIFDLADVEMRLPESERTRLSDVIETIREKARKCEQELRELPTPVEELNNALEKQPPGSWVYTAVLAGLARIHSAQSRWDEAVSAYEKLLNDENHPADSNELYIPRNEVMRGIRACIDGLMALGDERLKDQALAEAKDRYTEVLRLSKSFPDLKDADSPELAARFALVELAEGGDAESQTVTAIERFASAGDAAPGRAFGETIRSLASSLDQYWELEDALQTLQNRSDPKLSRQIGDARRSLSTYLEEAFHLFEDPSKDRTPLVSPIRLFIGSGLVPENTSLDVWPLFTTYIPAMRQRMQGEYGLKVPGVRVRQDNANPDDQYVIQIVGAQPIKSRVYLGDLYCLASREELARAGVPQASIKPPEYPLWQHSGCWVPGRHQDLLNQRGIIYWADPLLYIIHHLEETLQLHLDELMNVQEMDNWLVTNEKDPKMSALVSEVRATPDGVLKLRRVFKGLLCEGVPVVRSEIILRAVLEVGLNADVETLVSKVRSRLRDLLPGNRPGDQRTRLLTDMEDRLQDFCLRSGERMLIALPREQAARWLDNLRHLYPTGVNSKALVVRNPSLRSAVFRLVRHEYPRLGVLSQPELRELSRSSGDSSDGSI